MYVRRGNPYSEKGVEEYDWKQRLENQFDYSPEEYNKAKQALAVQFGHEPKTRDVVWSIYNKLVITGDTERVYLAMARSVEEVGKDPSRFYQQHRDFIAKGITNSILGLKKKGYKSVKYRNCNDELVCESCRSWEEKKFLSTKHIRK
jgi:hypothetical protein